MGQTNQRFSKRERLTRKKKIEELFKHGSFFYLGAFMIRHIPASDVDCHQVLISVPKKHFKRAVDRNLLKRRIKETYRVNKHMLYRDPSKDAFLYIAFVYLSKKILTFHEIQDQLIQCLERLDTVVEGNNHA